MSSRASTITDVAALAGVSIKTVSRVINAEAGVRTATRDAVQAAMAQLAYRPLASARSLAGERSYVIGQLYLEPCATFVVEVQRGAATACEDAGYQLVVAVLGSDASTRAAQVARFVATFRPDGLIITPPLCDDAQVLAAVMAQGTPAVLIAPGFDDSLPCVAMDDARAAADVADLLVGLGHRRIALVEGPAAHSASARRRRGFEAALQRHGLPLDPALLRGGDFLFPSGYQAGVELLAAPQRPTAVFASNDEMALGVMAAAQQAGLRLPQDLSVVGFDDAPLAQMCWPALTTVRQPVQAMAHTAVQLLLGGELAPPVPPGLRRTIAHQMVLRDSTHAPAA